MMYAGTAFATHIPPDLRVSEHTGPFIDGSFSSDNTDSEVAPGKTGIGYSAYVANNGGSSATIPAGTVIAKHSLAGFTVTSCRAFGPFNDFSSSGNSYSCRVTDGETVEVFALEDNVIGVNGTVYLYAEGTAPNESGKTITSKVTADPNEVLAEASEGNNTSNIITTRVETPTPADLSVTQIDTPDPAAVGGQLIYKIRVTNNGDETATKVVLEDYLPDNATYVQGGMKGYEGGYYGCNHIPEYRALVCGLRDIPGGRWVEVEVHVSPTATGTISNTATVYSESADANPSNDTAKEDTLVQTAPVDDPPQDDPPQDTTKPAISSVSPAANSTTRDRTPTVKATVRDGQSNLLKSNIKLYVDGKTVTTFSYSPSTDRLSYTTQRLSYATHTAKIVATDAAGNAATKTWRYRVAR